MVGEFVMYDVKESFNKYLKDIGLNILFDNVPGETVRDIRKGLEISQGDMADLLGVRRETISRIETGVINPTTSFIKRFSKTASIIKVFRDINALQDARPDQTPIPLNPTFFRTYFSLSSEELDTIIRIGNSGYNKTKNKILRRIKI